MSSCRGVGLRRSKVTRSRAYKKNDQAFVEQKNGAVVRRLVGYGRFEGVEAALVMARLYAAARLYVNFFQPSFKLKEKRREGAKVIKRYHPPVTPFERAVGHPKVTRVAKARLRNLHRALDPVALLAEMRAAQAELGERIDCRPGKIAARLSVPSPPADCSDLCEDTRQVRRSRRATRYAPAAEAKLRPASANAIHARSARHHNRRLARRGAAADRARHRRSPERELSRSVLQEAAFHRAASLEGTSEEGCREVDGPDDADLTHHALPTARGCGRRCV